jgi:hypothetical protein
MKISKLAVFVAAFGMSALPCYGQTENWDSWMEKAVAESNLSVKKQNLDKALRLAVTAEQRVISNLELSSFRYDQQIYGESIYFADQALEIVLAELPNNEELRTAAITRKAQGLMKTGREDEAFKIIGENTDNNTLVSDQIWKTTDRGITHRFTQFTCPDFVANMQFEKHTSYNQAGLDVGCAYEMFSEYNNAVTVYFTKHGQISDIEAIQDGSAAMLDRLPDAKQLAVDENAEFEIGGNDTYYTLLNIGRPQSGEQYTGAWTKVIEGWVLKSRITWDVELGIGFGAEKTKALFGSNFENIHNHLNICQETGDPKTGKHLDDGDALSILMLESVLGDLNIEDAIGDGDDDEGSTKTDAPNIEEIARTLANPKEPIVECFVLKSSGNELALGYHPGENTRYSVYSSQLDGAYFVTRMTGLMNIGDDGGEKYILKAIEGDVESTLQIYDGEPSAELVFTDTLAFLNGESSAISSVTVNESGGANINLDPSVFE